MVLTWKNVDAPDFRSSIDGIRTFGSLMNNAFGGLKDTVKEFDTTQSDIANNEIQMKLAAMQSVGDTDAIGSILAAADPRRLRSETVTMATGRKSQLLNQASTQQALDWNKTSNDRTQGQWAAGDQAAALLPEYTAARESGDPARLAAFNAANPDFMKKLSLESTSSLVKSGLDAETTALGNRRTKQTMSQDGTRFGWEGADRADQMQGYQAAAAIAQGSFDPASAMQRLESMRDQLSPRAYLAALQQLPSLVPGTETLIGASGVPAGLPGMGGAGSSPAGAILSNVNGNSQKEVARVLKEGGLGDGAIAGFLGNFDIEGGYGGAQGDGGSAGGIAQWRGERRTKFQEVIGKDPTKATMAEQAKFVLWEINNPAAAGMTAAQATQIKNEKDPAKAAALIDQFYERSNGKARNDRVAAAAKYTAPSALASTIIAQGENTKRGELNPDGMAANYATASQNNSLDIGGAATELMKRGDFKDQPFSYVQQNLREAIAKGKAAGIKNMTPSLAMEMLKNSTTGSLYSRYAPAWLGGEPGGGSFVDGKLLDAQIESMAGGRLDRAVVGNETLVVKTAQRKVGEGNYAAAMQRYQRAVAAQAVGKNVDLAAARRDVEAAGGNLNDIQGAQLNDPSQVSFNRPEQPTPGQSRSAAPARNTGSSLADSARPKTYGPFNIAVPEGKFRTQAEIEAYVNRETAMAKAATTAASVGGIVGKEKSAEFEKKYGITPRDALDRLRSLQG